MAKKTTGRPVGRPRTASDEDRAKQRREAQDRYMRKLRSRAAGTITDEVSALIQMEWTFDASDSSLTAASGAYQLCVLLEDGESKVVWWVQRYEGDEHDPVDVAEGTAPSVVAGMAAAEATVHRCKGPD